MVEDSLLFDSGSPGGTRCRGLLFARGWGRLGLHNPRALRMILSEPGAPASALSLVAQHFSGVMPRHL